MAGTNSNGSIDPKSGFCSNTRTFHSLRPRIPLPPPSQPLSVAQLALSLLNSSTSAIASGTAFMIDGVTGQRLNYSDFVRQTYSLALSLQKHDLLPKDGVAFILSPSSFQVPVLYFSLLSLGVTVTPANPLSSSAEISHQIHLCKPSIVFTTSHAAHKLPPNLRTILIDSPEFLSLLSTQDQNDGVNFAKSTPVVRQSNSAAILYSSGTTGRVKGVLLTHRNLISLVALFSHLQSEDDQTEAEPPPPPVSLLTLPMFHIFGFLVILRAVAGGETLVLMERFDFEKVLKAVENYKVIEMPVSPPIVVALTKSELTEKYDLSSLQYLTCGGAPLGKEVGEKFNEKFPHVQIIEGYGLTEAAGLASGMGGLAEKRHGSVGHLFSNMEAKIVDVVTGEALPPGQKGELWLQGPTIMKGYVGDDKATSETLDSQGWLKTGDLCYFDSDGFLFIVDRLKELIKYKGYQVPPAELEQLLQSNPEIADAAVIPYPDEEAGQIPMAFVVRKPGSNVTEAQIIDFVAKQVAPYKKVRRVAFINSIPKSPAGKILRRELVAHALSGNLSKL